MQPTVKRRNVGANRGKPRLWIGGRDLLNHGWERGTAYTTSFHSFPGYGMVLLLRRPTGTRHVAGSPDRPVIDLCTHRLLDASMPAGTAVQLTITADKIEALVPREPAA